MWSGWVDGQISGVLRRGHLGPQGTEIGDEHGVDGRIVFKVEQGAGKLMHYETPVWKYRLLLVE